MRKFVIAEGTNREITGILISMQLVPVIKMVRNDLEYHLEQENDLYVIYIDECGEIVTKAIYEYDKIKLL